MATTLSNTLETQTEMSGHYGKLTKTVKVRLGTGGRSQARQGRGLRGRRREVAAGKRAEERVELEAPGRGGHLAVREMRIW